MWKIVKPYVKIARFEDVYPFLFASVIAGIYAQVKASWIIIWGLSTSLIAVSGYMINEWVDKNDVDKNSWNPIHVKNGSLNKNIVVVLCCLFSISGMLIIWRLGLVWWGLVLILLSILYSVKPFRLKGVFVLDLCMQIGAMFLLPFLAVLVKVGRPIDLKTFQFLVPLCLITVAGVFLYQLADLEEDKKAGLFPTGVVLGITKSLIFGSLLAVSGVLLFFIFRVWEGNEWSWIAVPIGIYTIYRYVVLLRHFSLEARLTKLRDYIRLMKPISQFLLPYVFIWWIFMDRV